MLGEAIHVARYFRNVSKSRSRGLKKESICGTG
jgi:hypothetical protein